MVSSSEKPYRWVGVMVLLLAGALVKGRSVWAVTVILRGDNQPLYGYLVEETPHRIVVRVELPDGRSEERIIPRAQIELLYNPVDKQRLESLDPSRAEEYLHYAEELAEKKLDPEARQLSLRLYSLAAYWAPKQFGRSAALAMSDLAASDAERQRYRLLAFLLDGGTDRSLLDGSLGIAVPNLEQDVARMATYRALEAWRRGAMAEAWQWAHRPGVPEVLHQLGGPITSDDLLRGCQGRERIGKAPDEELAYQILLTERKLLTRTGNRPAARCASWSVLTDRDLQMVAVPWTVENLLPFDPQETLYRNGRWQRADNGIHIDADSR